MKSVSLSKGLDLKSAKEVRAETLTQKVEKVEEVKPVKKTTKKVEKKTKLKEEVNKESSKSETSSSKYDITQVGYIFSGKCKKTGRVITSRIKQKVIDNLDYLSKK